MIKNQQQFPSTDRFFWGYQGRESMCSSLIASKTSAFAQHLYSASCFRASAWERLKNERDLFLSDSMILSEMLSALPYYVFWKDRNLVFRGCNDLFAKQFSHKTPSEIIGKIDEDFPWSPELREKYRKDDLYVITEGKSLLNMSEEQKQNDGSIKTVLVSKVPLRNKKNEIVGVFGAYTDITHLKNIENALRNEKEKAEAANRAKAQFLANMSHDMLSPLSGILLAAEVINENEGLPTQALEMSKMISAAGKQLKTFFTSCLDLSKLEMEEWVSSKSVFSVGQLVSDIHDLYLPKAKGSGLSLSVVCDPRLPEAVEGHRESLYRALLNLAGNALKFTEKGGVILRAFCGKTIDAEHINILFQVEDTGMGIPEDKFKVIFEKLQRLTPAYSNKIEGSGIGLYIVDQFIQRMGGTIQIESEVGKGSKFTVSIPMRIAHAKPGFCMTS